MSDLPVWLVAGAFLAGAVLVWIAGTHLTRYVNAISDKTGLGSAFAGMLLLGGITSLPEAAASTTSSIAGEAPLAVNNLLGSLSLNLMALVIVDAMFNKGSLNRIIDAPSLVLQAALSVLLMGILLIALTTGDLAIGPVGLGSIVLFLGVGIAAWLTSGYDEKAPWRADRSPDRQRAKAEARQKSGGDDNKALERRKLSWLIPRTVAAALGVVAAGYVLSTSADAIAEQAGIGTGIVGLLVLGLGTSLPELSTVTAAARLGRFELAVGDVFGTNVFNLAIFLLADLAYAGGPIIGEGGPFEVVATLIALIITMLFLIGMLERREKTFIGLGYDSVAVVVAFVIGLGILSWISFGESAA